MAISRDVIRRAAAQPDRPAVMGPVGELSFGDLAARARSFGDQLKASGVTPGDPVPLADDDPAQLLVELVGTDLVDAVAVVTDADWPDSVQVEAVDAARIAVARADLTQQGKAACLAVFTSGSTGTPRPVVRTRQSWTYSFPSFSAVTGIGADDRVLVPGAMSASLFLYAALHALTVGAAVHPLRRWSPALAVEALDTCTAVHVVPAMLATLVAHLDQSTSRLRRVVCGGAHLDPAVDLAAKAAGIEVVDYYGAAELSFVAIRRPGAPVGRMRAFPGVDVDVRDGVIWARSPYVALGLDSDPKGFSTVGDLGARHGDGTITVDGRSGLAITTGGATLAPEAVEQAVREVPGVAEVAVIGVPHPALGEIVVALVEATPGSGVALSALRAVAVTRLPKAQRPRRWYLVDRLPRTGSGKVARGVAASRFSDGTLVVRALS
jgi:long-chain acyl-CoA synthetase